MLRRLVIVLVIVGITIVTTIVIATAVMIVCIDAYLGVRVLVGQGCGHFPL